MSFISNISNQIGSASAIAMNGVSSVAGEAKKGVLFVGEGVSRAAYDVFDLRSEGFEKWTKAVIADLKFLSHFDRFKGVFNLAIESLEGQKNLYYATKVFGSACQCIKVVEVNGQRKYSLTVPRKVDLKLDWISILYGIGNALDTAKFLKKHGVVAFKTISDFGAQVGSCRVSFLNNTRLDQILVVSNAFSSPKDLFILTASGIEVYGIISKVVDTPGDTEALRAANRKQFVSDIGNWLKLTGSVGKIILISFGSRYGSQFWFAIVDIITQNAGLIKYWRDRSMRREERFNHPAAVA